MGTESVDLIYESAAPYTVFFPEDGGPDERAVRQLENVMDDERVVAASLMADHHVGYSMPIGGVVAYRDAISPTGVGFDIACGNMAVQTDLQLKELIGAPEDCPEGKIPFSEPEDFNLRIKPVMRAIQKKVEFGVGGSRSRSAGWVDHELFDDPVWSEIEKLFGADLKDKARAQLGTVGAGNHYVDLLVDDEGWVWVANHFGSRGFGWTVGNGFIAHAQGKNWRERAKDADEAVVYDTHSEEGTLYVAMMQLAGQYAYAGREFVTDQVLEVLGAGFRQVVHNHHNYAWFQEGLWVVRKGATPLTREPAFIGGSMGDYSVIVRGRETPPQQVGGEWVTTVEDIGALGSAPHGAGRVMSRTAAAGKIKKFWSCTNRDCDYTEPATPGSIPKNERPQHCGKAMSKVRGRDASTGAINWQEVREQLTQRGITVLGAGADEAPGVYKGLAGVLAAHSNIDVLYTLRPIGVVMAAPDTFDPYKD